MIFKAATGGRMRGKMKNQRKHSILITIGTIILIGAVLLINDMLQKDKIDAGKAEEEVNVKEDIVQDIPVFYPEEAYDFSFLGKSAGELYEEVFTVTEEETEYVHFYVKEGTLYLDEYAQTDRQDEEGIYIYEWEKGQKIAENVIFIDYNWYRLEPNALYITSDHELHGTGEYEDIYLKDIRFASTYADQMLALTLDGNLWCRGLVHSISDGRTLEYQGWELIMQDVVYANLAHYCYMAITKDDSLYMWGDNTLGQFGDGSLLKNDSGFNPDCYFYEQPVRVADGIKMVWERHPGNPKQTEQYGKLRTYFLTTEDELYVSGEEVGEEIRTFRYYGELGETAEGIEVNCTSSLHRVEVE